jgi:hypothetical protein
MDPVEIALIIEKEKQKCLNIINKYYEKNKNKDAEKLYNYLKSEYKKCNDTYEKKCLRYDMEILEKYVDETILYKTDDELEE